MLNPRHECWAITDHAAGNQRQALALAERMDMPVRHLVLEPRAPWSWFAPRLLPGSDRALPLAQRVAFAPPWPRLAIGCGRSAALFTRMLRELSGGRCHTVQILDPRIDPRHWDAVVAPRHDQLAGANVLTTLGSLNPIDETWLESGREAVPGFASLPRPRVAVLVGGPRRGIEFDATLAQQLIDSVRALARGGSVLATTSRRTPPEFAARLRAAFAAFPGTFWTGAGANPYPALLGWADRIVATPDSVNMLSEACATGVPVHTVAAGSLPGKIARFHAALRARGLLTDADGTRAGKVPPLRETQAVAAELRKRMAARAAR